MRIVSSSIALASDHSLTERREQSLSLHVWAGSAGKSRTLKNPLRQAIGQMQQDVVNISNQAKKMLRELNAVTQTSGSDDSKSGLSDSDKHKIQLIEDFVYALTGKRIKISIPDSQHFKDNSASQQLKDISAGVGAGTPVNTGNSQLAQKVGWGVSLDYHQSYVEQEQTDFAASGVVKTADGREIDFSVAVGMSRQFASEQNISIKAGDAAIDPLVINFGGSAASLTQTKFRFDLDSDGSDEQVSFVNSGSGFLALDANGDGKINDGKELFGPQSGNGFTQLAGYDSDKNGWIDENDPIYSKLRIWTKDAQGNDQLFALGQKGIGAIYLGNVSTPFAIKDSGNALQGQVQSSGIFLREDGSAGTLQQVNLAV